MCAEDCIDAVDLQDNLREKRVNRTVLLQAICARDYLHAVRFNMCSQGHRDVLLRDITAKGCQHPFDLKHADRLTVSNVRGLDFPGDSPVKVLDCDEVVLRDLYAGKGQRWAISAENCNDVLVPDVLLQDNCDQMEAVACSTTSRPMRRCRGGGGRCRFVRRYPAGGVHAKHLQQENVR